MPATTKQLRAARTILGRCSADTGAAPDELTATATATQVAADTDEGAAG